VSELIIITVNGYHTPIIRAEDKALYIPSTYDGEDEVQCCASVAIIL
jgi:hypothetical protein